MTDTRRTREKEWKRSLTPLQCAILTSWQFDPETGPRRRHKAHSRLVCPFFLRFNSPQAPRCPSTSRSSVCRYLSCELFRLFTRRVYPSERFNLIHSPWRAFKYAFPALISCLAPGLNLSRIFCNHRNNNKLFIASCVINRRGPVSLLLWNLTSSRT